jgi:hypothetical protein
VAAVEEVEEGVLQDFSPDFEIVEVAFAVLCKWITCQGCESGTWSVVQLDSRKDHQ